MKTKTFYSNGKLLLTGEYAVLDGALSLAVPTTYGQSLTIEPIDEQQLIWTSFDENNAVWFQDVFEIIQDVMLKQVQHDETYNKLVQILNTAKQLNPDFLGENKGFNVSTQLTFPKNWGLGTSSTLINNIASWAQVDAYSLLENTFGGSGYDIACAQHNYPISYQINEYGRSVNQVRFHPSFSDHLYFVYLNKKQNSRDGIAMYRSQTKESKMFISEISDITNKMIICESLNEFDKLITSHENLIATQIKQKPIKQLLFNDFNGAVKSLGAWGGDFILATSNGNPKSYFETKGFKTVIPYRDMVL
ncbi:hypothetical protein GCM10007962_13920 [Yeosuana aromativorans]|uniref:GHMP kinase n=1 Tax=Yeosuana aromativorans TaxID=288019 RepID=A0A8J3FFG8_9FLAO|nr:GYDIA family GHMP kinase [Yeosuana aromativorans]GGK21031.1 hypothetical protein GCM10007962_13920 [Yeosuana aromativorans]